MLKLSIFSQLQQALHPTPEKPTAKGKSLTDEERQKRKEDEILKYQNQREITVEKFFQIAGLPFPEHQPEISAVRQQVISDFTTDPRRVTENSLFLSWGKSPASVGNNQTAQQMAAQKNCLVMITMEPFDYARNVVISSLEDDGKPTLWHAYLRSANYIRSLHKGKVIALTGSVGKTSTKEMVEAVLRKSYNKPLISKGNNNSMFSITRNIQEMKRTTKVYLQEVGAFEPRTVESSARQLSADMVIYTNIGESHIENYGSIQALADDKFSLSTYGNPKGYAFVKLEDSILMSHKFGPEQKVITYSLSSPEAMYYAKNIKLTEDGYECLLVQRDSAETHVAHIHAFGEHNVLNAVVAFAVGSILKLPIEKIVEGIESYRPSGMRQNLLTMGNYHVLADCYNSSLMAVDNILNAMDHMNLPDGGKRIAVLGDILALGERTEETHRQIGKVVASHQIDVFLAYGKSIALSVEEAKNQGVEAFYFSDRNLLENAIRQTMTPKDLILFKASHGVNMGSSIDRIFGTDVNESSSIAHKQFTIKVDGDFEFYIFETHASLKTYLGTNPIVKVPSTIEALVHDELKEETSLRTLNVEKIGKTAFRGMTHVKEVHLPETVVRIRDGAFSGSGITQFDAPNSLLSIGDSAFADCQDLNSLIIPKTILEIGKKVLENSPHAVLQYK